MDTNAHTIGLTNRATDPLASPHLAAAARGEQDVEDKAIATSTRGIYGFRTRHPFVYGLIAFVVGAGVLAVFTASTYSNWTFEGIDLVAATYQMIFGSLGGGIVAVVAAFAYAATLRPVPKRR